MILSEKRCKIVRDLFGGFALFSYLYTMNYKELAESLAKTVEAMSASIAALTDEVAQLKALLLEKDKSLEAKAAQLNGLTKIALPKKVERRSYVDKSLKDKTPAPTPKER